MPKVSVILTHQLDQNRRYLDFSLRGLAETEFRDLEVLLISGAESAPPELGAPFRTHWDQGLDTATKKIHWGIANSESDYILLHSDDVVLSRKALGELVSAMESLGQPVIMNPFSNSDCRSLYYADFGLLRGPEEGAESKHLIHDMCFEQIEGWEEELLSFPLGRRILLPIDTLSFYCTLIPRTAWDRVGDLDPALEYRHNDQDFCLRAKTLGIPSLVNLSPFAFHFGSKTLTHLATDAIKSQATAHFVQKYSRP